MRGAALLPLLGLLAACAPDAPEPPEAPAVAANAVMKQGAEGKVAAAMVAGDAAALKQLTGGHLSYANPGQHFLAVAPDEILAKLAKCSFEHLTDEEAVVRQKANDTSAIVRCDTAKPLCSQARFRVSRADGGFSLAYIGEWTRRSGETAEMCSVVMRGVAGGGK